MRLFRKIMSQMGEIPYPGELKNMLKSALAFSSPDDPYDYLRRLYAQACPGSSVSDLARLREQGFTMREIEKLSGVPRSTVSRELKEASDE